jgi:hypothetical protein
LRDPETQHRRVANWRERDRKARLIRLPHVARVIGEQVL